MRSLLISVLLGISPGVALAGDAYNASTGWSRAPAMTFGSTLRASDAIGATWSRLQLSRSNAGAPDVGACANATRGLGSLDTTNRRLYVCVETGSAEGWDYLSLTD